MPQHPHLHLDFETFSKVDLRDVGAYRYAFDPSTEILCAAMALGDGEPVIWHKDLYKYGKLSPNIMVLEPMWDALENPDVLIYAFSAQFEMAICQALLEKTWGIKCPDLSRFRCVQSIARRAALPASLDKLGEVLDLVTQKDKRGKALIKKFSMLQPAKKPTLKNPQGVPIHRIRPEDDAAAFAEFCAYCQQDVRTEQAGLKRLVYFDEPINNENYSLDAVINARGVTVNIDGLRKAQRIIEEETEIQSAKFRKLTGFEVTQNARLLAWCHEEQETIPYLPNLTADTIDAFIEKYDCEWQQEWQVLYALKIKQSIAYASVKKVATMLECAGPHDNRIRGMLVHHGPTTGRWSNQLVQFQNMKRPADSFLAETFKGSGVTWSEIAYRDICNGASRDMIEVCYGPPLEVISSCIRHFVHDVKI